MAEVVLSAAVRSNLLSLQNTAQLLGKTQERLATGLRVNSALDDPPAFFTASSLNSRAGDLNRHLDSVGLDAQTLKAADNGISPITKLVEAAVADLLSAYKLVFVPFGWRLQHLPVGPARRLQRGRAALHGLVDRVIADRRATGVDHGDLLSALVLGDPAEADFSDEEIRDHAVTLLLAGHETTANALTFAFHLMATHPEVEEEAHR